MGYFAHHAAIAFAYDFQLDGEHPAWPDKIDFAAWRVQQPSDFQPLLIGPIPSVVNGYYSFVCLPDGSKEGWQTSDLGDDVRGAFCELFRNNHIDVVEIRFGGDEPDCMWIEDRTKHEPPLIPNQLDRRDE